MLKFKCRNMKMLKLQNVETDCRIEVLLAGYGIIAEHSQSTITIYKMKTECINT